MKQQRLEYDGGRARVSGRAGRRQGDLAEVCYVIVDNFEERLNEDARVWN
jgi:hypothetical protein